MSTEAKAITDYLQTLSLEWYCEQNSKLNTLAKRMLTNGFNELGDWVDKIILDRGSRNLIHHHLSEAHLEVVRVLKNQETIKNKNET